MRFFKELGIFLGVVPVLSIWIPFVLLVFDLFTERVTGTSVLVYWFKPAVALLHAMGFSDDYLFHGGIVPGPNDSAVFGSIFIYTFFGLLLWCICFLFPRFTVRVCSDNHFKDPENY